MTNAKTALLGRMAYDRRGDRVFVDGRDHQADGLADGDGDGRRFGVPRRRYGLGLGLILLICTVLYIAPRTTVLGAILLTAYLGGAVATQLRVGAPLFTHILFGVYLGVLLWGGLWLRDARVRALIPLIGTETLTSIDR